MLGRRTNRQTEQHSSGRTAWLRAAVLGADDGIVSTASLMLGVTASNASHTAVITAGLAGLVAGAMSMAAGEYVSVASQRDAELSDLALEAKELQQDPIGELDELRRIYEAKGLPSDLADTVARRLSEAGALAAHARDELGLDPLALARPMQAAAISALSFAVGASVPLIFEIVAAPTQRAPAILVATIVALVALGALGARLGGASVLRGAARVLVGGSAAMTITWFIGRLAGAAGL